MKDKLNTFAEKVIPIFAVLCLLGLLAVVGGAFASAFHNAADLTVGLPNKFDMQLREEREVIIRHIEDTNYNQLQDEISSKESTIKDIVKIRITKNIDFQQNETFKIANINIEIEDIRPALVPVDPFIRKLDGKFVVVKSENGKSVVIKN